MKHVISLCCFLAGFAHASSASSQQIAPDALTRLPDADVVILGEIHDNPVHHTNQALALRALQPRAVVFEMLDSDQAARIEDVDRADASALEQALNWGESGWPDFTIYHPVFTASPGAVIYGGGLARAQVRRAITEGAAAVFGPDAGSFDLAEPLDETQQSEREEGQQLAHCNALPPELLPGMVEAQRLRDAGLARAVKQALDETGGPVAVITGNGHARKDWGLAYALNAAAPDVSILSIGQFEDAPDTPTPFDLWLVTPPTEREDPCAAFQ
ncbi:ChaN family lipoprotein [Actibacterium lipolyticum]|uniref:Haem-binding uptake Tiki superfamily ChaN domain-containing protein n=1 Tax=Actibacterium lipolyticum TaxID=1524263 RepID=A0A238JMX9_9RHOB|nr:ChaN family lipoprotein [Actibacterium lipolyticum]SMX31242.1 hypothetical protein COL8621_00349 [Actibacterium lipolyticum]